MSTDTSEVQTMPERSATNANKPERGNALFNDPLVTYDPSYDYFTNRTIVPFDLRPPPELLSSPPALNDFLSTANGIFLLGDDNSQVNQEISIFLEDESLFIEQIAKTMPEMPFRIRQAIEAKHFNVYNAAKPLLLWYCRRFHNLPDNIRLAFGHAEVYLCYCLCRTESVYALGAIIAELASKPGFVLTRYETHMFRARMTINDQIGVFRAPKLTDND